ncbi:MipA/OmpV family protein [Zoogloea sp.]|uniref:MipA/OmpV family protein n=1 Tax=Zoogloea sp. TaxID=49181 RepID=UPI0031FCFC4E
MKHLRAGCFCLALTGALPACPAQAEPLQPAEAAQGWSGTIGAGPIVFPRYAGSRSTQSWLIPLISANYEGVAYIEPLRAGMYFWGSADRKMGLGVAVEPRMGFKSNDARMLTGMATRHDSLEGGPAFDWDLGPVALSLSLFTDLTHSSRGGSGRAYVVREMLKDDTWNITAFAGVERIGDRVANYFFGVGEMEANAARPAYQARAASNGTGGFSGSYRLGTDYAIVFGLQALRLSGGLAHSPIVETRMSSVGWLGLAISL